MPNTATDGKPALIAFRARENFAPPPGAERLTLTLITGGSAALRINGCAVTLSAPCCLLSSWHDEIELEEGHRLAAKSISFHPTLINKSLTFANLRKSGFGDVSEEHDRSLLSAFLAPSGGVIKPLPQSFLRVCEWFDAAGKEYEAKSDERWPHRVRRCLYEMLFELREAGPGEAADASDDAVVDAVLNHIHAHFSGEVSLDDLCKLAYLNRTSLSRKFKARTRRTPIDYLLHHRLRTACELLTRSSLSIGKIAETTGFKHESYFTRQFTAKIGVTPTRYRRNDGFETLNTHESRIVDEF